MATAPAQPLEYPTFGLPPGSVRGIISVLICSFFWIVLLWPTTSPLPLTVPLGHFFLLTLVLLAFASQPAHEAYTSALFPWLMRVVFVGGSVAVIGASLWKDPAVTAARLTPGPGEVAHWPVLLGCLAGGFGVALAVRTVLGRRHNLFLTLRAWVGTIAMLLLFVETILQFLVLPGMADKNTEALKIWEGIIIAAVAAYFGARA